MPIPISLSGLLSARSQLQISAENIANVRTTSRPGTTGFTPKIAVSEASPDGGVRTSAVPRQPASRPLFAPRSPQADDNGFVNTPNISLVEEMVRAKQAVQIYKANVEALKRELGTIDDLLEAFAKSSDN